ncbi:MAG: type II secretion system secretin GspD [bacterium]
MRNKARWFLLFGLMVAVGGFQTGLEVYAQTTSESEEDPIEVRGDKVHISFPEMDLETVLKNFSEVTDRSFVLEEVPKGKVYTIGPIGPIEIPKEEALDFFVLILNISGYQVVETSVSNVYKVIRSADAMPENIPIYGPGEAPENINEQMVMRFINLDYVAADQIAQQMSKLASKAGGQVMAYEPTNTLIIVDTSYNIERMLKIIDLLDVPSQQAEMEIVGLDYAEAGEIAGILEKIYEDSSDGKAQRTATTRQRQPRRRRPSRQQQQKSPSAEVVTGGQAAVKLKIIPVERINSLVIITDRNTLEEIKETIAKLDIDVGTTQTIHVYYCQNSEASELASTLSGIVGGGGGTNVPSSQRGGTSDQRSPSAEASRREAARPQRSSPRSGGGQVKSSTAAVVSGILKGEISISSDEATNSLIIVATPQDYSILSNVIDKLDIPRRQVFVEAVLLEVSYNESKEAGTTIHGASPLEDEGMLLAGTGFGDVNSLSLLSSISSSGGSLALPNGITVGALGQPVEMETAGGDVAVSVPSAGMVVKLLASTSTVNVLSTPTLLTTDNEQASIEVGKKIPVPTGQTVSQGGFSNVSISRESVGIKLEMTPQINESNNVKLSIYVEISGAVQSPLGIDVNTLGVTTSIKTAETTVIVEDSQTIVIGGLMEDRKEEGESRVPFLGNIPVVGWLFKRANMSERKSNLIILLTPHIVKSRDDIDKVRKKIEQNYQGMMEEELIEVPSYLDEYIGEEEKASSPPPGNSNSNSNWNWTRPETESGSTQTAPPSSGTEEKSP